MKTLFSSYIPESATDKAFQHGFSLGETVCRDTMYICDKLETQFNAHIDYEVAKWMWTHFSEHCYCATWLSMSNDTFDKFAEYYGFTAMLEGGM